MTPWKASIRRILTVENKENEYHIPVLTDELVTLLQPFPDGVYVDCTLGGGGHSALLLRHISLRSVVVGLDRDGDAILAAKKRFEAEAERIRIYQGKFSLIQEIFSGITVGPIMTFIFDLGVSSHQLNTGSRGFSYRFEGPLDMRMNGTCGQTLRQKIKKSDAVTMANILAEYGDIQKPLMIARQIAGKDFVTTTELKTAIRNIFKTEISFSLLSRIFMAFRIWVNEELDELRQGLNQAFSLLAARGKIAVISYHSAEDRIVKQWAQNLSRNCVCAKEVPVCVCGGEKKANLLTPRPLVPQPKEISRNERARSAKLRVVEKI
jgi:16S rRNA (cytosine1402-N4)-methyltransferase